MDLLHLTYVSRSLLNQADSEDAVADIVERSAASNRLRAVSGTLIYTRKHFAQFIEGAPQDVIWTFDKIKADARHTECRVVGYEITHQRYSDCWLMSHFGYSTYISDIVERCFSEPASSSVNATALVRLMHEIARSSNSLASTTQ